MARWHDHIPYIDVFSIREDSLASSFHPFSFPPRTCEYSSRDTIGVDFSCGFCLNELAHSFWVKRFVCNDWVWCFSGVIFSNIFHFNGNAGSSSGGKSVLGIRNDLPLWYQPYIPRARGQISFHKVRLHVWGFLILRDYVVFPHLD